MEEKRILIVDDAVFMRKMIIGTLKEAGYKNFLEAKDGEEGVALFKEKGADLVFMDVTMPKKSGVEALQDIKEIDPDAKVVMCSAIGQDGVVMDAIQIGASEFIVKPFKKEQLIEVTRSLIG